ncbi:hypothetical protein SAMN05216578_10913 [Halopseudomonas formosensis]|uniref:Uncharacterized protein n=1 Tax=Halopseudomonas formosensis TaxID=1002526 RepID=A0A1I6BYW0_9GAMM|nr:hypothetical protein [Halopseudomonas formosensis]SFQ86138.1 hypothetical protein SAMN05216578_10913 [Halopseudomonas formosensis]
MSKQLEKRLAALEQGATDDSQRVTRIEFVNPLTGEVAATLHVGGPPNSAEVLKVLEYKHETDPPRIQATGRN